MEKLETATTVAIAVADDDDGNRTTNKQQQQQHRSARDNGNILDRDRGHRYGNFPNYSSFHPPQARLQILESTGILHHIRHGLVEQKQQQQQFQLGDEAAGGLPITSKSISSTDCQDEEDDDDDMKMRNKGRKRMRMSNPKNTEDADDSSSALKSGPNQCDTNIIIYYCDLGCNSGELTTAVATSLLHLDDCGNTAAQEEVRQPLVAVHVLGIDLDPTLVKRANDNFSTGGPTALSGSSIPYPLTRFNNDILNNHNNPMCGVENGKLEIVGAPVIPSKMTGAKKTMKATFMVCDLNSDREHNAACASFLANDCVCGGDGGEGTIEEGGGRGLNTHDDGKQPQVVVASPVPPPTRQLSCRPLFHLTTIFSTTMWIHVHGGDDGLRSFIERACHWTSTFLLVEPQPSGCYRKVNTRLRKMESPELDVASARLTLRPEIEKEIECIIIRCGFRRVAPAVNSDAITSWNRSLRLYERIHN